MQDIFKNKKNNQIAVLTTAVGTRMSPVPNNLTRFEVQRSMFKVLFADRFVSLSACPNGFSFP